MGYNSSIQILNSSILNSSIQILKISKKGQHSSVILIGKNSMQYRNLMFTCLCIRTHKKEKGPVLDFSWL